MALPLFAVLLGGLLVVTAAVALIFWPRVLKWAEESLLPWLRQRLPFIGEIATSLFVKVDQVASSLRRALKAGWSKLCTYLLKMVMEIHRKSTNEYVRRVTSWIIAKLESPTQATKVVTEEVVDFDDLPQDVREAMIRNGAISVDVREVRTREINELVT